MRRGEGAGLAGLALFFLAAAAAGAEPALDAARRLRADGDYDGAVAVLEAAIEAEPARLELRVALQNVEFEAERPGLAEKYGALQDGSADRRYLLARARPSAEEFEAVLKLDAGHVPARRARAVWNSGKGGDWGAARREFEALIAANPADAETRHRYAMALLDRGGREEALAQWGRAVEAAPGFAEGWYGLGIAWSAAANWHSAAVAMGRAVELDPSLVRAREGLILALAGLSRWGEAAAQREFLRARHGRVRAVKATILLRVERTERGWVLLREALAPGHAWIFRLEIYDSDPAAQAETSVKPIRSLELRRDAGRLVLGEAGGEESFREIRTLSEVPPPETLLSEAR